MLTSASYATDVLEFFAMVQSYTIILDNVPLRDDIWLAVFVWAIHGQYL